MGMCVQRFYYLARAFGIRYNRVVLANDRWLQLPLLGTQYPGQGLHMLGCDLCMYKKPTPWAFSIVTSIVILLLLDCAAWQRGLHDSSLPTSAAGRPLCPCRLQLSEGQVDAGFTCYRMACYILALGNLHMHTIKAPISVRSLINNYML